MRSAWKVFMVSTLFNMVGAGSVPAASDLGVEKVLCGSELVVLGKLVAQEKGLTYSMEVERYLKGRGPKKLIIVVTVGRWTDDQGRQMETSSPQDVVGASVDENLLAFLESLNGGYRFKSGTSGKYLVETDPETGKPFVRLRWKKKRYMRGEALKAFSLMEAREEPPDQIAKVEAWLDRGKTGLLERILVEDLPDRLQEVWQGEFHPDRCFPDRGAEDPNTTRP